MESVPSVAARKQFADLLGRVGFGKERVVITRQGKPLVALVPVEDLEALERLEDRLDIGAARAALAAPENQGEHVPWSDLKKATSR